MLFYRKGSRIVSRQVQCTNSKCGSYNVISKPTRIHRITHEWAPTFGEAFFDIFGLAFWGFLGFIALSLAIVGLLTLFQSSGFVRTIIGILYLISTVILAIIVLRYVIKNFKDWAQSDPAIHYHCLNCEYEWNAPVY